MHRMSLALALLALVLPPPLHARDRVLLVHLHPQLTPRSFAQSPSLSRSRQRHNVHQTSSHIVHDVQLCVGRFLRAQSATDVHVVPLWIQNTLIVRYNEDNRALSRLLTRDLWTFPGVVEVEEDARVLALLETQQEEKEEEQEVDEETEEKDQVQTNVQLLHAPELWAQGGRGNGIVVASIDSGVRYTHDALSETFRGAQLGMKHEKRHELWTTRGLLGADLW